MYVFSLRMFKQKCKTSIFIPQSLALSAFMYEYYACEEVVVVQTNPKVKKHKTLDAVFMPLHTFTFGVKHQRLFGMLL